MSKEVSTIVYRGYAQPAVKELDKLGYKYHKCSSSLPKDYDGRALILTFVGRSYTIIECFPKVEHLDDIFRNRFYTEEFNEFKEFIKES